MADVEKAFSDLDTASQLDNTDIFALSKVSGNSWISAKATLTALATKIATAFNFTGALQTTNKTLTGAINEIAQGGGGGSTDIIADDFSTESTYAVGDYVIYEGDLYKCTTAVTTAGAWDSTKWTETLVMDEVEAGGGGGSSTLAGLTDVDLDNLADGQILVWDDTNSKWVNANNQGSGGSGNSYEKTSLYTATQVESLISLSQSMANFDLIELVVWYAYGSEIYTQNAIYNAQELIDAIGSNPEKRFCVNNDSYYCWYRVNDVDELQLMASSNDLKIQEIYGYKFNGGYTEVTGTLTAGSTSITLSDAVITTSSTIEVFNDLDVPYNSKTLSTGSITLTFDAQQSNMSVKVRVS